MVKICLLIIIALSVLIVRFHLYYQNKPEFADGQLVNLQGTITSEPKISGNTQRFNFSSERTQFFVTTARYPEYIYRDSLFLSGTLKERVIEGSDKVVYTIYFPKIAESGSKHFLAQAAKSLRERTKQLYDETLPQVASALLTGIVFGVKQPMPESFTDDLKTVGLMHVIAASGMNVSMVAGAFLFVLGSFLSRRIALIGTLAAIIFYAALAGFEPSIIRASIMGVIAFTASLLGRQNITVIALILTGYGMLLFDPGLLENIGFQLSFLATAGIIFLKPLLPFGQTNNESSASTLLSADLGTTLSAQIATLPVLLGTFGSYGLLSIIGNLLVLWSIPPLMVLGGAGAVIGFVASPLAKLLLYLSLPLLSYFEAVVSYLGAFELQISLPAFPLSLTIGYFLLLVSLVLFKQRRLVK